MTNATMARSIEEKVEDWAKQQFAPGSYFTKTQSINHEIDEAQLFRIKKGKEGSFSIWTKETLEQHGFYPEHATYYIVIPFENAPIEFKKIPHLKQHINTYRSKIRPLSDFIGLK